MGSEDASPELNGPFLYRLALEQARRVAGEARGLADEELLQPRHAVDEAEPDVAHCLSGPKSLENSRFSTSVVMPICTVSKRRQC